MTRTLTIEEHLEPRRNSREVRSSRLRLKGRWLTEAGFTPGQRVTVQAVPGGLLVLKP